MSNCTFVPPRRDLPDEWAARLREVVVARHDIRAVYWLTTLHETDDGTVVQDELHIELAEPPGQVAGAEQYREMSDVIPAGPERSGRSGQSHCGESWLTSERLARASLDVDVNR